MAQGQGSPSVPLRALWPRKAGIPGSVLASSLDQSDSPAMLPAAPKGENLWPNINNC